MHYNPDRHHGEHQTPANETALLRRAGDEHKHPFDLIEPAPAELERESHRVMDGLLRECLKRTSPTE